MDVPNWCLRGYLIWVGATFVATSLVTLLLTRRLEYASLVAFGPFAGEHLADSQGCAEESRRGLKITVFAVVLAALRVLFACAMRRSPSHRIQGVALITACLAWFGSSILSYLMVLG